jgi:hypothetical protein
MPFRYGCEHILRSNHPPGCLRCGMIRAFRGLSGTGPLGIPPPDQSDRSTADTGASATLAARSCNPHKSSALIVSARIRPNMITPSSC